MVSYLYTSFLTGIGSIGSDLDEAKLYNAFISFGEIKEIFVPRESVATSAEPLGFAFVEFESIDDAKAAIDNMHMGEIFGRTIRCNLARPTKLAIAGVPSAPGMDIMLRICLQ